MNKDMKKYFKDIKLLFPVFSKDEKTYFNRFKEQVLKENNDLNYKECIDIYGQPTDLILEYYENVDTNIILKKIKLKNIIKKAVIIIIALVVGVCLWKSILIYSDYKDSRNSKIDEIETTIEIIERIEE